MKYFQLKIIINQKKKLVIVFLINYYLQNNKIYKNVKNINLDVLF